MAAMLRYTRVAVTALSARVRGLLIALWVRSWTTLDTVFWPWTDHAMQLSSLKGHVVLSIIGRLRPNNGHNLGWSTLSSGRVSRVISITTFSDSILHVSLAVFALICRIAL